jgi:xanthine/CO dehydrogenase XdhC/CoxF family maturation factor
MTGRGGVAEAPSSRPSPAGLSPEATSSFPSPAGFAEAPSPRPSPAGFAESTSPPSAARGGEVKLTSPPGEAERGEVDSGVSPAGAGNDTAALPASATFTRHYDPPMRLLITGAVHIAQALAPIAAMLGFAPHIVDPRGAFAAGPRFAGHAIDPRWPDEAIADWRPDGATAVVALSHDPKLDDPALAAALRSDAFYIAALGSRKNHAGRLARLAALGFDAATLARIHGPAGLAIGAANPAEIALSIAAQMIAAWRDTGRADAG